MENINRVPIFGLPYYSFPDYSSSIVAEDYSVEITTLSVDRSILKFYYLETEKQFVLDVNQAAVSFNGKILNLDMTPGCGLITLTSPLYKLLDCMHKFL